ncbi:MAG: HNH endonuclease, partial [Microbacterium sp.]
VEAGLGAIRATLNVTVPLLTLAGLDDAPAVLDSHGPIDAETARVLAAAAPVWQRVMTHPVTEEPLRLDIYRPSGRLRRLLNARDRTCRWPGCRRPASRSEADHTIAWEDGGTTCPSNLEILCKGHHTLKHASAWTLRHLGGGRLEFISPTRRRYRNDVPAVVEALGPPPWRRLLEAHRDASDPPPF